VCTIFENILYMRMSKGSDKTGRREVAEKGSPMITRAFKFLSLGSPLFQSTTLISCVVTPVKRHPCSHLFSLGPCLVEMVPFRTVSP